MPYCAYVRGFRADVSRIPIAGQSEVIRDVSEFKGWDFAMSDLESGLEELASRYPELSLDLLAEGEDGGYCIYALQDGKVAHHFDGPRFDPRALNRLRSKHAFVGEPKRRTVPTDSVLCGGSIKSRIAAAERISRARNANKITDLLKALDHPNNQGRKAEKVRSALYEALSWHETEEVKRRLVHGLKTEEIKVLSTIRYVSWRQDALVEELPAMLREAWDQDPRDPAWMFNLLQTIQGLDIDLSADWLASSDPLLVDWIKAPWDAQGQIRRPCTRGGGG